MEPVNDDFKRYIVERILVSDAKKLINETFTTSIKEYIDLLEQEDQVFVVVRLHSSIDMTPVLLQIKQILKNYIIKEDTLCLEEYFVFLLKSKNYKVSTAESLTGGMIAQAITSVSGASAVFNEGYITYSNESKQRLLNVDSNLLINYGAVSEEVVRAMAKGLQEKTKADVCIAVSGIAGPTGGSTLKPVGTVWFAFAVGDTIYTIKRLLDGNREQIRLETSRVAFDSVIRLLKGEKLS